MVVVELCATDGVAEASADDDEHGNHKQEVVRIGQFLINIDEVTKDSLKSMRTYWPAKQYRTIKNRKSARLCRNKKKSDLINIDFERNQLLQESQGLRLYIDALETMFLKPEERIGKPFSLYEKSKQGLAPFNK